MVVRDSDIVATCTDSTQTVFDEPAWRRRSHITCVRACETGPEAVKRCDFRQAGKEYGRGADEGMIWLHGNAGILRAARGKEPYS
jgi:ornithine cyclodeaminase/alanine dehydrogenase-like protein (mu-crystallin family)